MKYIFSIALFVCLVNSNPIFSQKGEVKKDAFTGEKVVSCGNNFVYFENKVNKITFKVGVSYPGQQTTILPARTEVLFKLQDGAIIKLLSISETKPISQVYATQYSAGTISYYTYEFVVTKEIISQLSMVKLDLIRFPNLTGGTVDIDSKSRFGKKYSKSTLKAAKFIVDNF